MAKWRVTAHEVPTTWKGIAQAAVISLGGIVAALDRIAQAMEQAASDQSHARTGEGHADG